MKVLLSLLILTILGSCYTQNADYVTMTPSQFRNNAIATQLRETGIQLVLAQAVELNVIAAPNYVLSTTDNVASRTSGSYNYYRYTVSLINPNDDVLDTTFVMRYNTNTQASDLFSRSWHIQFANATSSAPAYISLDPSEFNTPFIQKLANFGKDFIENRAISLGWISPGTYNIVVMHYVQRQDLKDGSNYQISLNFKRDGDTREVKAGFRIKYVTSTEAMSVEAFHYQMVPSTTAPTVTETPSTPPAEEPVEEEIIVAPPTEEEIVVAPPAEEEIIITPPVEEETIVVPPAEEETIIVPPVEEEAIIVPPVEEEAIVVPPVEEPAVDSTPQGPFTGTNTFGFSTRPVH